MNYVWQEEEIKKPWRQRWMKKYYMVIQWWIYYY